MATDTADSAQVKVLEMAKMTKQLAMALRRAELQPSEMAEILTPVCTEPAKLKEWTEVLDKITIQGITETVKDRPNVVQLFGLSKADKLLWYVDSTNDHDPWNVLPIQLAFVTTVNVQFNQKLNALDPLTQIGAMKYFNLEDGSDDSWDLVNPAVWTSWHGRGTKATLKGAIKFGKTNFALFIAERLMERDIDVKSNISVKNPPKNYAYCPDLATLLQSICDSMAAGHEVAIIFDEANLFWHKTDTVRPRNVDLGKLALCFGKMHSSLLFISHYTNIIPSVIVENSVAEFAKVSIKSVRAEIRFGIKMSSRIVSPVPATTLVYDPDQLAWFRLNLDIERLFNYMSSLSEDVDQWKAVNDYVEKHKNEMRDEDIEPKVIAQWLHRNRKMGPNEIGDILGRNESTIREWIKAST